MIQNAKSVVRAYHETLDNCLEAEFPTSLSRFHRSEYRWLGVYPFQEASTPDDAYRRFWLPLKKALSGLHRRDDIFFAGMNEINEKESVWVVSMGHLQGLFDQPWLNIQPNGKLVALRYCTFHKIEDSKITQTVMHIDIPYLMAQAGQTPFPTQTGSSIMHSGPVTLDGILRDTQPVIEGEKTLAVINGMINNLGTWNSGLPLEEELALNWHQDMTWWGPHGIGTAHTIERYAEQHARPFRQGFANRSSTNHIARLAEGHYGGFFGWPNFTAQSAGGFMGMPAKKKQLEFRVIDIYRRKGEKLAENWVFIDLPYVWKQMGFDIFNSTN